MYNKVNSCVRNCDSFSDFFEYSVGLRQGEVISPIMCSMFLEDLELYLQATINCGLNTNVIAIIVLLFADDMVLLGRTPSEFV